MKLSLNVSLLILTLMSCQTKDKTNNNIETINFKDTIHQVSTSKSQTKYYTYYFKPTDALVDTSSFHYSVCKPPYSKEKVYNIYFPRIQVINFCDSMMSKANIEWDDYVIYKSIMEQAQSNKNNEVVIYSEIAILLDRFSPFIINPTNRDKPKYVIIKIEDFQPGPKYRSYLFKTTADDSVYIDAINLRPITMAN